MSEENKADIPTKQARTAFLTTADIWRDFFTRCLSINSLCSWGCRGAVREEDHHFGGGAHVSDYTCFCASDLFGWLFSNGVAELFYCFINFPLVS